MKIKEGKPASILNPICRGIVGYVSYLASCGCSEVYSEHLLYEPILRIAKSKGYSVKCEYPVEDKGARKGKQGDFKRIDFSLKRSSVFVGIEVKWAKAKSMDLDNDIEKLKSYAGEIRALKKGKTSGYVVASAENQSSKV